MSASVPASSSSAARFASNGSAPRPLLFGIDVTLSGQAVIRRLARELPDEAADLMEIAASIHAIDRLAPRPPDRRRPEESMWTRSLWAEIPVREPDRWRQQAPRLVRLLHWLTDDHWDLEFCQLRLGTGALDVQQGFLFETVPSGASPVLFSGGLDSAAGLAAQLVHEDAVAVSVHTNGWMWQVQRRVLAALNQASSRHCMPLRYRISVSSGTETSQRSRGFLFLAAGVATAWAVRQDQLRVFENGIGAINLPYLRSQQGSQASKSAHPATLASVQELATAVSGRSFLIEAPAMMMTKAELVRLAPLATRKALELTVSCDAGFSARVPEHRPCGACTSCLLRCQSLNAAGLANLIPADFPARRKDDWQFNVNAMCWQVTRLRACLESPEPWQRLICEFPELIDVAQLTKEEVVRLYRAYVNEWDTDEHAAWLDGLARRESRTVAL